MTILFSDLNLHTALLNAVDAMGYSEATPVQEKVMPHALAGNDLMVSSQTGSGKTAAFLLPILDYILNNKTHENVALAPSVPMRASNDRRNDRGRGARRPSSTAAPQAIVLCPTRELAQQVAKEAIRLKGAERGIRISTVVGGMPYGQQIRELENVTILVATPGRLLDLYNQRAITFESVRFFVADEADRMLDLGFADDLKLLHSSCKNNQQTLMFSATFPKNIMKLGESMMKHPIQIELATKESVNTNIEQRLNWADNLDHQDQLLMHWLRQDDLKQAVVFTSTQIESEKISDYLEDEGFSVAYLHGGIPQKTRNRRLDALRSGRTQILVATDVAARGIDVPSITHVINYGLPMKAEDYVHRIGRTGRAGRTGMAVTIAHPRDRRKLTAIVQYTSHQIEPSVIEGLEPQLNPSQFKDSAGKGKGRRSNSGRGNSSGGREQSFGRRDNAGSARKDAPKKPRSEMSSKSFFGQSEGAGASRGEPRKEGGYSKPNDRGASRSSDRPSRDRKPEAGGFKPKGQGQGGNQRRSQSRSA